MPKQPEVKKKKPKKDQKSLSSLGESRSCIYRRNGGSNSLRALIVKLLLAMVQRHQSATVGHQMYNKVTMHRITTTKMPGNITITTEPTIRRLIMPNSNNITKETANIMPIFKIHHTYSNSNHMVAHTFNHKQKE